MEKSDERKQFLADVLCTYLEGGIQLGGIGWVNSAVTHDDADGIPEYDSAVIQYEDAENGETHTVTPDTVARGLGIMAKGPVKYLGEETRNRYLTASRENDGGDIDAPDATNIIEVALFGEVVYG